MRELIVETWCDACEGNEPAVTTPPITVGGARPRTLDLCEVHRKDTLDALVQLLKDRGALVEASMPATAPSGIKRGRKPKWVDASGPFECLVPGCPSDQTYSNRKSLGGHLNREHRVTITDYEAVHGRVGGRLELQTGTPASNPEVGLPPPSDSVPDELRCGMDDCPVYYDPAIYARPHQALGVHRRMRHGVLGKGAQVADKGDAQ
jgi:hypothetical protein